MTVRSQCIDETNESIPI